MMMRMMQPVAEVPQQFAARHLDLPHLPARPMVRDQLGQPWATHWVIHHFNYNSLGQPNCPGYSTLDRLRSKNGVELFHQLP